MRRRVLLVASAALVFAGTAGLSGSAATPSPVSTARQLARQILESPATPLRAGPEWLAIEATAGQIAAGALPTGLEATRMQALTGAVSGPGLPNVRVNDPQADGNAFEQTTQMAPSMAVSGSNVVVGYLDTQNSLLALGPAADFSGVSYSSNGGQTFVDGGGVPNLPGSLNFGEASLAADSAGTFYYSTLLFDTGGFLGTKPGVARSTDGGKTWSIPTPVPAPTQPSFVEDKPSVMASGGVLYETWIGRGIPDGNGLIVARSSDGGATWRSAQVATISFSLTSGCFLELFGTHLAVAPDGTLYLATEQWQRCNNNIQNDSELIFSSKDAGTSWTAGTSIPVTSATQNLNGFGLGPGQLVMGSVEEPSLAFFGGALYMAWNDGGDGSQHSHIRLARSADGGKSWTTAFVTAGLMDEVTPVLGSDGTGLHIAYREMAGASLVCLYALCGGSDFSADGNAAIDVMVSNSTDGLSWTARRITSESFGGIYVSDPWLRLAPLIDPIAGATDGAHQYFAWTDNRGVVTNWLWPQGRHDSDVFFAKQ